MFGGGSTLAGRSTGLNPMESLTLIATATFGLEALVKREVAALGFEIGRVADGRIEFHAAPAGIARANLWLRCADRVLLKMGEFTAVSFDELFDQTHALPWEGLIPRDGRITVNAKTHKSAITGSRGCQAIVKKAVAARLQAAYGVERLPESGADFTLELSILKDVVLLAVDTSGAGLHKRGYRTEAGEAPLKETLAAALVLLSVWDKTRLLIDPLCGSGTILIEAALQGRNVAPGLQRRFAAEEWPLVPAAAWETARAAARAAQNWEGAMQLHGYDVDPAATETAVRNAARAGVGADIVFAQRDVRELWLDRQYGVIISNPPYGVRMADFQAVNQIYIALHKMLRKKQGWSVYILTADKQFPRYFKRARPDRVRKLYNGRIEVNYYQYLGAKPPG